MSLMKTLKIFLLSINSWVYTFLIVYVTKRKYALIKALLLHTKVQWSSQGRTAEQLFELWTKPGVFFFILEHQFCFKQWERQTVVIQTQTLKKTFSQKMKSAHHLKENNGPYLWSVIKNSNFQITTRILKTYINKHNKLEVSHYLKTFLMWSVVVLTWLCDIM